MKVVIFGNGWMGNALDEYLRQQRHDVILARSNITNQNGVSFVIRANRPDVIINAVGKTGNPNIDWCGASDENAFRTWRSNVLGSVILRESCESRGIYLIHLSTGDIFNREDWTGKNGPRGREGFGECFSPNPPNEYARSKALAEENLRGYKNLLNIRFRIPFWGRADDKGNLHPRDLLAKITSHPRVLAYERNSITYVPDLLDVVNRMMERHACNTYNVVNPGPVTNDEILELYREIVDPGHKYSPRTLAQFIGDDRTRERRSNCVLRTDRLELAARITLPDTVTRLRKAFTEMRRRRDAECLRECMIAEPSK